MISRGSNGRAGVLGEICSMCRTKIDDLCLALHFVGKLEVGCPLKGILIPVFARPTMFTMDFFLCNLQCGRHWEPF